MTTSDITGNEHGRIEALKRFKILDTPADGAFDNITALASEIFNVPIAIISLVDTNRIWFKSHYGLPVNQIDRTPGLCASAILSKDPYIVENAIEDSRTLANPLVAGDFGLRFYAAVPLQTDDNFNLGTLCIIDKEPRAFAPVQVEILKKLSRIVMDEMEMRLTVRNAVEKIKNLTSDISGHLTTTIKKIDSLPLDAENSKLSAYMDASRIFLSNIDNQLEDLN